MLTPAQGRIAGPWRNVNAPYLVGLMDLMARPYLQELDIMKSAQAGVTDGVLYNGIGWAAECDPDPAMLVMPDEQTGRQVFERRLVPMFTGTKSLAALASDRAADLQLSSIRLQNGFGLLLAWANSPARLASWPIRRVFLDEVDKFPKYSGREANPVELARMRTQTYRESRLIVCVSTPTTSIGTIAERYAACPVHIAYYVPCPHCRSWQTLTFDGIKWDKLPDEDPALQAEWLRQTDAVWYQCVRCDGRIVEAQKPAMLEQGRWATCIEALEDAATDPSSVLGLPDRVLRVGAKISALYAKWYRWSEVAAEFIASKHDPAHLQNFSNSILGEPFEQRASSVSGDALAGAVADARDIEPNTVPMDAQVLLCTVDVQLDHFYYVIRAWSAGLRSQLIRHGIVRTLEEMRNIAFGQPYPFAEPSRPPIGVAWIGIDAGAFTDSIYRFTLTDPHRIKPMKGFTPDRPWPSPTRTSIITKHGDRISVLQHQFDTGWFKDRLASMIAAHAKPVVEGEPIPAPVWRLNGAVDTEYLRQLRAEHKVVIRKGGQQVERWQLVRDNAANHYLDCEVMNVALAHFAKVEHIPQPPTVAPNTTQQAPKPTPVSPRPFRRSYGGV